jgi:hypothetical protein
MRVCSVAGPNTPSYAYVLGRSFFGEARTCGAIYSAKRQRYRYASLADLNACSVLLCNDDRIAIVLQQGGGL